MLSFQNDDSIVSGTALNKKTRKGIFQKKLYEVLSKTVRSFYKNYTMFY
jgi:hypothetical protein